MGGNSTTTLMSAEAQPVTTTPKCLSFWYHMFGRDPANFSLILNTVASPLLGTPQILWVKRRPQSNNWIQAQVNIPAQTKQYWLMFRASLVGKSTDNIGLDDIVYSGGVCPPTSVCDFEVKHHCSAHSLKQTLKI